MASPEVYQTYPSRRPVLIGGVENGMVFYYLEWDIKGRYWRNVSCDMQTGEIRNRDIIWGKRPLSKLESIHLGTIAKGKGVFPNYRLAYEDDLTPPIMPSQQQASS